MQTNKQLFLYALAVSSACLIFSCASDTDGQFPGAQKLSCAINTDVTLSNHNPDGVDYYADCDVMLNAGTLTIEPGTTIMFMPDAGLNIVGTGVIRALGTVTSPVTIGGESTLAAWDGIYFESGSPLNEMSFCNITGGGHIDNFYNGDLGGYLRATVSVEDGARLTVNNCVINGSAGIGLAADQESELSGLVGLTISNCASYPMLFGADQLSNTINLNTCAFTGNQQQYVAIYGSSITTNVVISASPIPYFVMNFLEMNGNGNLTLNQGVTMHVSASGYIQNNGNGFFNINGTVSQPVVIRGAVAVPGYWQGIIVNSDSPLNVFDYLQISDGGSQVNCFASDATNIQVGCVNNARLTINNCSSSNYDGCQVAYSTTDGTLINNSPDITNVCAY